jgi:S1-C subfamily serine protease
MSPRTSATNPEAERLTLAALTSLLLLAAGPRCGSPGAMTPQMELAPGVSALNEAFIAAADAVRPGVVRIDVELEPSGAQAGAPSPGIVARGTGSGVILDPAGNVLTNSHVVERARSVELALADGRSFPGQVVGQDPLTDVAVVRFAGIPPELTVARLGEASRLRVGEWVLAVGSPLGLSQSVTAGIVSGLGRVGPAERVMGFIQTDASINPGNSGGPLVNLSAEVVGINTFINIGPGGAFGFAVPIGQAVEVARTLIEEGRVRYPYLGVRVASVNEVPFSVRQRLGALPEEGALVLDVLAGSPAAEAGVRPGDVVTRLDDQPIASASDLVAAISRQPIGGQVELALVRGGQPITVLLTLRELPG